MYYLYRKEDLCDTKASSHELSEAEKALLKLDTVTLVSETNKGELQARVSCFIILSSVLTLFLYLLFFFSY